MGHKIPSNDGKFKRYAANGYTPYLLPIAPRLLKAIGKAPGSWTAAGGWNGFRGWRKNKATPDELAKWETWPDDTNVGLLCGDVLALDIDFKADPAASDAASKAKQALVVRVEEIVAEIAGEQRGTRLAWRKRADSTSCAFFLRSAATLRLQKIEFSFAGDTERSAVELLAHGQQIVISGRHAHGAEIINNLAEVALAELPLVGAAEINTLLDRIAAFAKSLGFEKVAKTAAPAPHAGAANVRFGRSAVVERAVWLARGQWVADVLPYGVDTDAPGDWRISSTSLERELQEDLCIYAGVGGAFDHGSKEQFSPVGLIRRFGALLPDGEITYGGAPLYGEDYQPAGEPDDSVRRPTEAEALRWLYGRLSDGRTLPSDVETWAQAWTHFGDALAVPLEAVGRLEVLTWFGELDDGDDEPSGRPTLTPETWTPKDACKNAALLPALRLVMPEKFERLAADARGDDVLVHLAAIEQERARETLPAATVATTAEVDGAPPAGVRRLFSFDGPIDGASLPPQRFLIHPRLPIGLAAQIVGEPAVYKSTFALSAALVVASGREDILRGVDGDGRAISYERLHATGNVLVYNAEDGRALMQGRIAAVQNAYRLKGRMPHRIYLWSGQDDGPLRIARRAGNGRSVEDAPGLAELERLVVDHEIKLVILDTQISLAEGLEENSNSDMEALISRLNHLASRTDCAIAVNHHTAKSTRGISDDMGAGRGGFSAAGSYRVIVNMTHADASGDPIEPSTSRKRAKPAAYIRMQYTKATLTKKPAEPVFFVAETHDVGNGDTAAVPRVVRLAVPVAPAQADGEAAESEQAVATARILDEALGAAEKRPFADLWKQLARELPRAGHAPGETRQHVASVVKEALGDAGVTFLSAAGTVRIFMTKSGRSANAALWIHRERVVDAAEAAKAAAEQALAEALG